MTFLKRILKAKQREIDSIKELPLPSTSCERRDFLATFREEGTRIIAEIKKASPSKGIICNQFDPVSIARVYQENGACALSVVTEKDFFLGDISYIEAIKKEVSLPVLRKDFILEEIQVRESLSAGADAVLLIARLHTMERLKDLVRACIEEGLVPFVEVHSREDLDKALATDAIIIGVNNRDLSTFKTDIGVSIELKPFIPNDRIAISESGIERRKDIETLERIGYRGFLIGESLLREKDMGKKLKELLGR